MFVRHIAKYISLMWCQPKKDMAEILQEKEKIQKVNNYAQQIRINEPLCLIIKSFSEQQDNCATNDLTSILSSSLTLSIIAFNRMFLLALSLGLSPYGWFTDR